MKLATLALLGAALHGAVADTVAAQAARMNNIGTALMNQQLLDKAEQRFATAYAADPKLAVAEVNRGIALLYLQKLPESEAALKAAAAAAPGDPHAWYALGLLYRSENKPDEGAEAFRQVLKLAPGNADAQYFLGSIALEQGQFPEAVAAFEAALKINPLHASAEFGLARALQREGKTDEARAAFGRFQHVTHDHLGAPLSHNYGEEGAYGRVEDASAAVSPVGAMIRVAFKPGWQSAEVGSTVTSASAGGVCAIERDGTDAGAGAKIGSDLVVVGANGVQLLRNTSASGKAGFVALPPEQTGLRISGSGVGCAVGDYDNDGLPDIAVATAERVYLFRNSGGGKFENVTQPAGLKTLNVPTGVTFVDYDHDGDLDLLVTGAARPADKPADKPGDEPRDEPGDKFGDKSGDKPAETPGKTGGNVLYRNNGNKTFTNWTSETGLGGPVRTAMAVPSDVNNDRAIDLVIAGAGQSPVVYLNPREGAFDPVPLFAAEGLAPSTSLAMVDTNKDGWMDVAVTHAGAPGVSLWRNEDGRHFERVPLPVDAGVRRGLRVSAVDFDNDGWIDLVALVETTRGRELRAYRNLGPAGFKDVTAALGLDKVNVGVATALLAADVDGDDASDLVLADAAGGVRVLENVGGSRNHALRIALKGVADNWSAIGTKVEVFGNGLWQKWEAVGQPEILAGLGQADSADLVRLLWPTGVPQDELDVSAAAEKPVLLTETDRRGSSCPTLFAWDGAKYGFVADVIGAGVVGHWVSPTARNTPDPDEWIKVEGAQLQERDGMLSLRFGEPMEEVNYVDQVRLMAVDHPAGTEVNPHEGFRSEPPFASGEVVGSRGAHPPVGAWDSQGRDVLALLAERDHRYVRDFTNLAYAGFANEHTLTLDLGTDAEPGRPLRLLLHGFVEYFSASSMYAAWQAGLKPEPPYVEAQLADGSWRRVMDDMGFPAGLPRTVVVDLTGKLPAGTRRVRIVTNLQLYWDQVLVDTTAVSAVPVRTTELRLGRAELDFRGYPHQIDGRTPGDLTYDYARISQAGPFVPQRGAYTRYGVVTPLLTKADDEFVIFGTGEDMDLEFAAAGLPPLAPGWVRDYFFYANGFVKDMDFYEAEPFTVDTLPFHAMSGYPYRPGEHYPMDAAHLAYELEWNTRFESGDRVRSFQFDYVPRMESPETGAAPVSGRR